MCIWLARVATRSHFGTMTAERWRLPWWVREQVHAQSWASAVEANTVNYLALSVTFSGAGAIPHILAKVARLCRPLYGVCTRRLLRIVQAAWTDLYGRCPPVEQVLRLQSLPLVWCHEGRHQDRQQERHQDRQQERNSNQLARHSKVA